MLIIWMQDMIHRNVPLSGLAIRHQALDFYKFVKNKAKDSSNETFVASRGWFDRFRKRYSLHNVTFSGEKASADAEAAAAFPPKLRNLIEEKGYVSDQIFNCTKGRCKRIENFTEIRCGEGKQLSLITLKPNKDLFSKIKPSISYKN